MENNFSERYSEHEQKCFAASNVAKDTIRALAIGTILIGGAYYLTTNLLDKNYKTPTGIEKTINSETHKSL